MGNDKVVNISFNVWANSEEEADELKHEICAFIDFHGRQGRKVTASKLTDAIRKWENNALVRQSVIRHFQN